MQTFCSVLEVDITQERRKQLLSTSCYKNDPHLSTLCYEQLIYQPDVTSSSSINEILGHLFFSIFGPMVIFFGPFVFIYLVVRFRYNDHVSPFANWTGFCLAPIPGKLNNSRMAAE